MDEGIKVFVGLDVHKDTIAMVVAHAGREPGRVVGQLPHDVPKLLKALNRLGDPATIHVVYEAGPTGYGLQRALSARGYQCEVIAPSLVPKRAGDRIKTDQRDSRRLAELARAGELRAVWIPDPADESIRDLARAREGAVNASTQARHQRKAFLLRHQIRYSSRTAWTLSFLRWLGDQKSQCRPPCAPTRYRYHTDVRLHTKMPLVAFLRLMHFGIAPPLPVLG